MSTLTIRLPADKHERLRELARQRGISINRLMDELSTIALVQHDAEIRFRALAAKGSPQSGLRILEKLDRLHRKAS
ncbi:MAG: toxin-antitoxin system HicB family antitoxin [Deltaproteobacteria bacterium]|nr:toxin-antitoxin system HicB family antitoxin [Deltaproteobacteria bacterium]